jgi:hypothetical protein
MNASLAGILTVIGSAALFGCASHASKQALPPSIEVDVSSIKISEGTATVSVTNHSRRRVLVLTNILVWRDDATPTQVDRPGPGAEDIILMMHDARLEAGQSRAHMEVRLDGSRRASRPAVYACWDNRTWTCDRYWLIPATRAWDSLIQDKQELGNDGVLRPKESP